MKTIKCPKCGDKMEVYGVTEKGLLKYHCAECYFTTIEKCEADLCEKVAEMKEIS